ncbi:DUF4365 domain-containing protein [Geodermatophilus sp. DSM 45219]|uniref:DUF4365 domain-containing protein n=1 Tax=Geodermatophilus sp. DSM 45219 TaxID=1881103 RepID=UPI00159F99CD|nr:DUF4365 domain-containing protein [Geodermatophilus sp. DSM 45219]
MPETALKEQLSLAYVQAVATAAACTVEEVRVDYSGIDVTIKQEQPAHTLYDYPEVDLQLKCTSQASLIRPNYLAWSLDRKKYDHLRAVKVLVPRILVVMACPSDFTTWVDQDDQRLTVAHAAYWMSLRGAEALPETQDSKVVHAPRSQPFNVEQLLGIMARIGEGGTP